jgi:F0F1-type ATP synthase assembly protein I
MLLLLLLLLEMSWVLAFCMYFFVARIPGGCSRIVGGIAIVRKI